MSAFSCVLKRPDAALLDSEGHRVCERYRWSDWGQAHCSHLGEHSVVWASAATSLTAMCKDELFIFLSPGISMRNPWVYSMHNGLLHAVRKRQQTNIVRASFSFGFPCLPSRPVRESSCSNIYKEKTRVIKLRDLPTCASACNMLLYGLGFSFCSFYPLLPEQRKRWMMGQ